jgi:hypothetical protein
MELYHLHVIRSITRLPINFLCSGFRHITSN